MKTLRRFRKKPKRIGTRKQKGGNGITWFIKGVLQQILEDNGININVNTVTSSLNPQQIMLIGALTLFGYFIYICNEVITKQKQQGLQQQESLDKALQDLRQVTQLRRLTGGELEILAGQNKSIVNEIHRSFINEVSENTKITNEELFNIMNTYLKNKGIEFTITEKNLAEFMLAAPNLLPILYKKIDPLLTNF